MNGWRARLVLLLLFFGTAQVHAWIMKGMALPPTDEAGLFFFGTAAAVDWFLLYSAPRLIDGRLCDDLQASCIACIVINAAGLCAYLAYTPPALYYIAIKGVTYAQYLRLIYVGRNDADYIERAVFSGPDCVRA